MTSFVTVALGPFWFARLPSMAKSRRVTKPRTSARKPARIAKERAQTERRRPVRSPARGSSARTAGKSSRPARTAKPVKPPVRVAKPVAVAPPTPAPPPPRKPTYHEAVAMYERGLQALQRRDFAASADALRAVLERYPAEPRVPVGGRRYLKVFGRELGAREPPTKTRDEGGLPSTRGLRP